MEQSSKHEFPQWLMWAFVAVLAFGVGFMCWYLNDSIQVAPSVAPAVVRVVPRIAPTISPASSVSATPVSTADWKTYTNTKYNFSLEHPASYSFADWEWDQVNNKKISQQDQVYIGKASFPSPQGPHISGNDGDSVSVDFYMSINPPYSANDKPAFDEHDLSADYDLQKSNGDQVSWVTIAGEKAVESFNTKPDEINGSYTTFIQFDHDSNLYSIWITNSDGAGTHDKIIDQIISTLKFTK